MKGLRCRPTRTSIVTVSIAMKVFLFDVQTDYEDQLVESVFAKPLPTGD